MRRKLKRKFHNKFLWLVTYSAFILVVLSSSSIGSDSWIPAVTFIGSLIWLLLFSLANQDRW